MNIRCLYCGRFIGYDEFDKNLIGVEFTPDTEYTTEEILHYHFKCEKEFMEMEVVVHNSPE
jgi:hypothetical protein